MNLQDLFAFNELLLRVQEGDAGAEECRRLNGWLRDDPDAMAHYLEHIDICTEISRYGGKNLSLPIFEEPDEEGFSILKEVVEQDIEIQEEAFREKELKRIRQIADDKLRDSLQQASLPAAGNAESPKESRIRNYLHEQKQRFRRPVLILAACVAISLLGYFVYDRFLDASPRLQYASHATVVRDGQTLPAQNIRRLKTGDLVKTGVGGSARIYYRTEKTSFHLEENTHFAVVSREKGKKYHLIHGRIDAVIAPQSPDMPLTIETDYGRNRVLGTDFQLAANPLGTCLAVRSGCVQLSRTDDGRSVIVDSGRYTFAAEAVEFTTRPFREDMDLSSNYWRVRPHATGSRSIAMEAIGASRQANVEYYFACISGEGHDSGWQRHSFYEDKNLRPDTEYTYQMKVRYASGDTASDTLSFVVAARTTDAITLEAEAGEIMGALRIGHDAAAGAGRYIYSLEQHKPGDFNYLSTRNNQLFHRFNVKYAGYYHIRSWCQVPDMKRKSVFVTIDNHFPQDWLWDIAPAGVYSLDYVNDRDRADPVNVWLDKGEHTITFNFRQSGIYLDWFELEQMPIQ